MITILVLGPEDQTRAFAASHPSVEILTARGSEDALEKLARNRRIDAVLILDREPGRELAEVLREEDPSAPPLFAPASSGPIAGVKELAAESGSPEALLDRLVGELEPRT